MVRYILKQLAQAIPCTFQYFIPTVSVRTVVAFLWPKANYRFGKPVVSLPTIAGTRLRSTAAPQTTVRSPETASSSP